MSNSEELEYLIFKKFSFLQEKFGFKIPVLNRNKWNTTVSYLSEEIGIEIELDWRDLDVFILITNLEDGNLPKGYYMSQGKKRRIHIEDVLQNILMVDEKEIQEYIQFEKKERPKRNYEGMKTRIESYQKLLNKHAGAICNAGCSLFEYKDV